MSWQMKLIKFYARATRRPRYASERAAEAFLSLPKKSSHPPKWLSRRHDVDRLELNGFDVYSVRAKDPTAQSPNGVIYVHGGGYVSEIQEEHWRLIADLADATGAPVFVPIYGLAPNHRAAEAISLMQTVLHHASASGPAYLIGDSSGGGLALAATMTWLAAGGQSPSGLTLISPWLDIALRNPDIDAVEPRDPWLARAGLRLCGSSWAANLTPDDPEVSPIFGDLTGLPTLDVYIGTDDIFLPDCRTLRGAVPPNGIDYHEESGAIHVYPLLPTPEGRAARRNILATVAALTS
jgi:acetyl esterase/lipase